MSPSESERSKDRAEWFEIFVVVEPTNPRRAFPLDMLRYATCVPATESDSKAIEWSVEGGSNSIWARRVVLRRFTRDGDDVDVDRAGDHRWRSFGWEIVGVVATKEEAEFLRGSMVSP